MSKDIIMSFDTGVEEVIRSDFDVANDMAKNIIQEIEERNDPFYGLDALRVLQRMSNTSGLVKAQILHYLQKNWHTYNTTEEFINVAVQYGLRSSVLVKRYIDIWDMFDSGQIPDEVYDKIKSMPINDLVPIMSAVKRNYNIQPEQWNEIAQCTGNREIAQYIRENVTKKESRGDAILFRVDKTNNMLYAIKQGTKYPIAKLNLDADDEVIQLALTRILYKIGVPNAL